MADERLLQLIEKYLAGKASEEERLWVENWFEKQGYDGKAFYQDKPELIRQAAERSLAAIRQKLQGEGAAVVLMKPRRSWRYVAAVAASVLLCSSIGFYFYRHHQKQTTTTQLAKNDIAPGGNKAILTLSNGQKIILDGRKGQIASQGGKQVSVGAADEVVYSGDATSGKPIYNTLTVPIGNRRDLVLPDGSKVNLDAGSSITYPVVFSGDRKITLTGQAYLTVKHDASHPFYTTVKGITIKDIGTEFNVNAYDDEPSVKTTLISGSVKVHDVILQPGEQAQIKDKSIVVKKADLDAVTAWKNNDFYFSNESLRSSMQQIARWYNVSVVYNHVDDKLKIFMDVSRSKNLSVVLKALENTGKVKCRVDGHTITVSEPD